MQILSAAVAAALLQAASASAAEQPARKRSHIRHTSAAAPVHQDEAHDPYLGLAAKQRGLAGHTGGSSMPMPLLGASYCTWSPDYVCYESGWPACCGSEDEECPEEQPPCDVTDEVDGPVNADAPSLPTLTLPPGGLRTCNEPIPSDFPENIIPKEIILAIMEGTIDALGLGDFAIIAKQQMASLVQYDVRAHKVCTTCEDANALVDSAADVMPYCAEGSFASGRTMSGLLLEPIDSDTKEPIVGKVAATIYNFATDPNPFLAPSQTWPSNVATDPPGMTIGALATSAAGTYTLVPDVLGNGEDWENVRSYIVKTVYQASAVPLLLKVQNDLATEYACTELDKRDNIMGFSEGGYATVAIAQAVDMLDDGYVHTYTGVGGAPLKWSTEQTYAIVQMNEGTYPFPPFSARLGNAYSSTNVDLANTGMGQELASDEYLDSSNPLKDVREWAKAGISYEQMFPLMPQPATDMMNPDVVEMVLNSWAEGNNDPCNSEFASDAVDKMCQAFVNNDVSSILEGFDFPVTICHSPDDELIYYSNVPNTTLFDHLTLVEDVPLLGAVVNPSGTHLESGAQCLMADLFPFIAPAGMSNVRSIVPLDDESCGAGGVTTTASTTAGATTEAPPLTEAPPAATPPAGGGATESPTPKPTSSAFGASASSVIVAALAVCISLASMAW